MIEMHGKLVSLRRPSESNELMARVAGWLNDKELMKYSEQRHQVHTPSTVRAYRACFDQDTSLLWDVYVRCTNGPHIGTLTAFVDPNNRSANMGILIAVGRHGYGTEAWRMALTHLKTRADFIEAGMMASNRAMAKICQKNDMIWIGTRRRQLLLNYQREDVLYYAWEEAR
jgi:[ribosomal protein S5]-alanine N-acetyltransferase